MAITTQLYWFQQHFKEKTSPFFIGEEERSFPSRQCTGSRARHR